MKGLFTSILIDLLTGSTNRRLSAVESLDLPPRTPTVARWRRAAFWLFMAFAVLLLVASLLRVAANQPQLGDFFGWTGVVCFELAALCVLQYARRNRRADPCRSARSAL